MMDCKSIDVIIEKLPPDVSSALERCKRTVGDELTELSLRADRPVCLYIGGKMLFLTHSGALTDNIFSGELLITPIKDIETTVLKLCDYSVYAYQEELNSGFITIGRGVRVGLSGQAVIRKGSIANIRDISSLNFRVSREVKGCSEGLLKLIDPLKGVLICGEPSSGKTTLIRDMARILSYRYRVSLLDERFEISAVCRGRNGFDIGLCDVFAGYPKSEAAVSAVRSMAPDIIVCDELGDREDVETLSTALRCGTAFIASVHASSMDDLRTRKATYDMISASAFRYIVFLSGRRAVGRIDKIYEMRDRIA